MADAKISDLTEKTKDLIGDDLLVIVDSEAVPLTTKKIKKSTAFSNLSVNARKSTPGTINPGQAVYIVAFDTLNNAVTVELSDASDPNKMPAYGICEETITDSDSGLLALAGKLFNIDTSSYAVGSHLYVGTTPGTLTATRPTGTNKVQKIAQVSNSNATTGVLEIFGPGRVEDLPNLTNGNFWLGAGSALPTETNFDTAVAANSDVAANTTHRGRTDNPHSVTKTQVGLANVPNVDATQRSNHTGTQLAATISDFQATVSANTNVSNNTAELAKVGWLQYSNATKQTTVVDKPSFTAISFTTDRGSRPNSQFTKFSATEFQTDFTGWVEIVANCSLQDEGANNRDASIVIVKNGSQIPYTHKQNLTQTNANRYGSVSTSAILSCVSGDKFSLGFRNGEISGNTIAAIQEECLFTIKRIRG